MSISWYFFNSMKNPYLTIILIYKIQIIYIFVPGSQSYVIGEVSESLRDRPTRFKVFWIDLKTVHSFYLLAPAKKREFKKWYFLMSWKHCRSDMVQILDQKTFYIPNFHLFVGGERGFRFQVHKYAIYECIVYWHLSQ